MLVLPACAPKQTYFFSSARRRHAQVPKICNRACFDPDTDTTTLIPSELQVIHEKGGTFLVVEIQPRPISCDHNSHVNPSPGRNIGIALVGFGRFLSQAAEDIVGICEVLDRMVTTDLVIRNAIGWAKIDILESQRRIDPE
jgi:hypothetical protein